MGKKSAGGFRRGASKACEATLYEFVSRGGAEETAGEPAVERIAASSLEEGLAYLRRWRPEFEVTSMQRVGLVTLLYGIAIGLRRYRELAVLWIPFAWIKDSNWRTS